VSEAGPTLGGAVRALASRAAFFVAAVLLSASAFATPVEATTRYLAYAYAFALFPGVCCYLLARPGPGPLPTVLLHGWVIGQLMESWSYVFLLSIGQERLFPFYPALFLLLAAGSRRLLAARLDAARGSTTPMAGWTRVAGFFLLSVVVAFPAFLSNFRVSVDGHFTWVAAYANSTRIGWPLEEPFLTGIPLHYHYLPNMHIAAASDVTGVPVLLLSARLFAIVQFILLLALVADFAQARLGSWAAGVLAMAQILSTYRYPPIGSFLHQAGSQVLVQLPSALQAYTILLVVWREVVEWLSDARPAWGRLSLVAAVLVASSGIRAQLLPILLAGFCVLAGYLAFSRRPGWPQVLLLPVAATVALLFGLWFFYGLGSSSDATGVIEFRPLNDSVVPRNAWFRWAAGAIGSQRTATAAYIAVSLVARLGCLLPGAIAYFIWFRRTREAETVALLMGAYLAGAGALVFLGSPFQEQWNFQLYGDLAMGLLGATGLVRAIASRKAAALALMLLGVPGLAVAAYEFLPPFSADLRRLPSRAGPPSYRDDPSLDSLVRFLTKRFSRRSVIVTGGDLAGFDDRMLPVLVPGTQLFASRGQLAIYLRRTTPSPTLSRRYELLSRPWDPSTYALLREEAPADRRLLLLWVGVGSAPPDPGLRLLFSEGRYTLFRIRSGLERPDEETSDRPGGGLRPSGRPTAKGLEGGAPERGDEGGSEPVMLSQEDRQRVELVLRRDQPKVRLLAEGEGQVHAPGSSQVALHRRGLSGDSQPDDVERQGVRPERTPVGLVGESRALDDDQGWLFAGQASYVAADGLGRGQPGCRIPGEVDDPGSDGEERGRHADGG
jgi:hypothetical protein